MIHQKLLIYSLLSGFIVIITSCADTLIGDQGKLDEDIYLNYQTVTDLELPFAEQWYVVNGGKTHREGAHHFINRGGGERYAIDFVKVLDTVLPTNQVVITL